MILNLKVFGHGPKPLILLYCTGAGYIRSFDAPFYDSEIGADDSECSAEESCIQNCSQKVSLIG